MPKSSLESLFSGGTSVSPVGGFVSGLRLAESDRRERQSAELKDDVYRMQAEQARMELDDHKAGQALRDMERQAKQAQALSVQALQVIDQVPDEQLGPMVADYMTRMPLHGAVRYQDGKLIDMQAGQQAAFVPNRQAIKKMMLNLADPDEALKRVKAEYTPGQYVVNGEVVSLTPGDAARTPGARPYDDVNAGVSLGKAASERDQNLAQALKYQTEAQWIGPKAQADIGQSRASAASSYASAANSKASAAKTRAELDGVSGEAFEKQKKAMREETEFILKQLKIGSASSGMPDIIAGSDSESKQNMLATVEKIATNAQVDGKKPYSDYEQQAATRALRNMQKLEMWEDPTVTQAARDMRERSVDRMSGQLGAEDASRVVESRDPATLQAELYRLVDLYGEKRGVSEFRRVYGAPKPPRH